MTPFWFIVPPITPVLCVDTTASVIFEEMDENKFWSIVGSAEADSEHPLGRCIAEHAKAISPQFHNVTKFKALSGMGIRCRVNNDNVIIGNRRLMDNQNIDVNQEIDKQMTKFEEEGKTAMIVAINSSIVGLIAVSDPVRPEAKAVISILVSKGITPCIISGDNHRTVRAIAQHLNIEKVFAEVLPAHKKEKVEELQKGGHIVAMVGDGINDAPALTQADVGIAVGSGTDVALESASIVLMRTDLTDILLALDLSAATYRRIKINFVWAFLYNLVSIPVAAGAFYPLLLTPLPPWVAGLAMALSSISVLLSSLLLKRYKPPKINLDRIEHQSKLPYPTLI
eukprot:TRINITY_DN2674_c0_g2_i2.p1 TRINITY_DN2674_c0_g2~~TRINITY_DN2674_c0_g2_i2.p1  ORF type:complete len:340 (+),score=51.00 TRINITY_DN2674_c0_g2_i2:468-1487(+)